MLYHPAAGIFPLISYFYIPTKMQRPLWLMLGTAALINPQNDKVKEKLYVPFITCAHTVIPWRYLDPESLKKFKIEAEHRKSRFIYPRIFSFDLSTGVADPGNSYLTSLYAVHPTEDCALLHMSGLEADRFLSMISSKGIDRRFVFGAAPKTGELSICGFRGAGKLGETDSMDPNTLTKLPESEQRALLKEHLQVEGKQVFERLAVRMEAENLHCRAIVGSLYHGMSGSPAIQTTAPLDCSVGLLSGGDDQSGMARLVAGDVIQRWVDEELVHS